MSFVASRRLILGRYLLARTRASRLVNYSAVTGAFRILPRMRISSRPLVTTRSRVYRCVFNRPLPASFPDVNLCLARRSAVAFNARRFAVVRAPKRSPKDIIFVDTSRHIIFANSALFRKDVNHASFGKKDVFDVVGDLQQLYRLSSSCVILPKRKQEAAVNLRYTAGPFVSE